MSFCFKQFIPNFFPFFEQHQAYYVPLMKSERLMKYKIIFLLNNRFPSISDRNHGINHSFLPVFQIATRETYGSALVKLYKSCPRVVALDGDTKNSTHSLKLKKVSNDNYIECFIAEQNLIGVAVGCGTRHRTIPFASTFACFLTRGFDQIRMAAISQANVKFCGSHCGVSIG
jgi:transketolase